MIEKSFHDSDKLALLKSMGATPALVQQTLLGHLICACLPLSLKSPWSLDATGAQDGAEGNDQCLHGTQPICKWKQITEQRYKDETFKP